jgi:hypothetical protein
MRQRPPSIQPTDTLPPEVNISSEYINAKFRAWLQRRGLTNPAFQDELRAFDKRSQFSVRRNRHTKKSK